MTNLQADLALLGTRGTRPTELSRGGGDLQVQSLLKQLGLSKPKDGLGTKERGQLVGKAADQGQQATQAFLGGLYHESELKLMLASPTQAAEAALTAGGSPSADHPAMQHASQTRAQLEEADLPTKAEGVDLYVLGEPDRRGHGGQVVRALAGPTGLGQGATVHLDPPKSDKGASQIRRASEALAEGRLGLDEALKIGGEAYVAQIDSAQIELKGLREQVGHDGKVHPANLSWGQSVDRVAGMMAGEVVKAGPNSALLKEANQALVGAGKKPIDLTQPSGPANLKAYLSYRLQQEVEGPRTGPKVVAAKRALAQEVEAARGVGILPIAAVGNEGDPGLLAKIPEEKRAGVMARYQSAIVGVPGILFVGASELNDPLDPADDSAWARNNFGAQVLAPGQRRPVGPPIFQGGPPSDLDGTSFAAPYVGGVAGLMIAAHPKITVDQLEAILKDPSTQYLVPGSSVGVLNEVAAVQKARDLRPD